MAILMQLSFTLVLFIAATAASKRDSSQERQRWPMPRQSLSNKSRDYYLEIDDTEKWNQLRDEVEEHWKALPATKHHFQVGNSRRPTTTPGKRKTSKKIVPKIKHRKRKAVNDDDYYEDYQGDEEEQESPSARDMVRKFVPYLLQKYRPKRLHLYTNRKLDLDDSGSHISSTVEDGLNNGRFSGYPGYAGALTPKDVIGKISTIPRRPCHGPACHEHHKGLVRFYWRKVIFPKNRIRKRQRNGGDDYDDEEFETMEPRRQRNRGRRRQRQQRNRSRGRNRTNNSRRERTRGENYDDEDYDDSDDDDDTGRSRNRKTRDKRNRNRDTTRNRQGEQNRDGIRDTDNAATQVYQDRNDYEERR